MFNEEHRKQITTLTSKINHLEVSLIIISRNWIIFRDKSINFIMSISLYLSVIVFYLHPMEGETSILWWNPGMWNKWINLSKSFNSKHTPRCLCNTNIHLHGNGINIYLFTNSFARYNVLFILLNWVYTKINGRKIRQPENICNRLPGTHAPTKARRETNK